MVRLPLLPSTASWLILVCVVSMVQVYPRGWSAILVSLDNQGTWNLRSAMWARQYTGQQLYIRVWTSEKSYSNEYDIPHNALFCGKATGLHA